MILLHIIYRFPLQHDFELSGYPSMEQGVTVASNPTYDPLDGDLVKYELPANDPFSASKPVYQDPEPSSDMLKGKDEHDCIPAKFTDSYDDAIAKAGDILSPSTSS